MQARKHKAFGLSVTHMQSFSATPASREEESSESSHRSGNDKHTKLKHLGSIKNEVEKTKTEQSQETLYQEQTLTLLKQISRNMKLRSLLSCLLLIVIFIAYFLGSYFMAINNFKVTASSVQDLNVIMFKEACFENMITFIRENQIRNESVYLPEDLKTVASVSLINGCQVRENTYLNFRRNPPSYL